MIQEFMATRRETLLQIKECHDEWVKNYEQRGMVPHKIILNTTQLSDGRFSYTLAMTFRRPIDDLLF